MVIETGVLLVETGLESWTAEQAALLEALPIAEQERIMRYRRRVDRLRALTGAILPRLVIARRYGVALGAIELPRSASGKPFYPGDTAFCFNLSHAGRYVALALGSAPVGVDCERVQSQRDWDAIAARFFAPVECDWLAQFDAGERCRRFFELWSRKESVLKASGDGLSGALNAFSAIPGATAESAVDFDGRTWFLRSYAAVEDYSVALCAATPGLPEHPIMVDARAGLVAATDAAISGLLGDTD